MTKQTTEISPDLFENATLPASDLGEHTDIAGAPEVETHDPLNAPVFEGVTVDRLALQSSLTENIDADEAEEPVSREERVRGFFGKIKEAAGRLLGTESAIGSAVQSICSAVEDVACKVVEWWVAHSETKKPEEESKLEDNNEALDLVADILLESAAHILHEIEEDEEQEEEKRKNENDPLRELMEREKRVELEKIDSPFFIEALESQAPRQPIRQGGSRVDAALVDGALVEIEYAEDTEGRSSKQSERVRIAAPHPELVTIGSD